MDRIATALAMAGCGVVLVALMSVLSGLILGGRR